MLKDKSQNFSNVAVLVTGAGSLKSACNYKLAMKEPPFLNIGTSLAIDAIKKRIIYEIYLLVENKDNDLFKLNIFDSITIIEVGKTKNITQTIEEGLKCINAEWILINPITSIPEKIIPLTSFIEVGNYKMPKENWSAISFEKNGDPIFYSKNDISSLGINSYPFTGRILAKIEDIKIALKTLNEFEKSDLLNLAEIIFKKNKPEILFCEWLDIGHKATFPLTRISTITSRFFNYLSYDKRNNTIKKKSRKKIKIENEILFYTSLPNEIKRYFPTILNVEREKSFTSYEMDYIGKPSLAEVFLFGNIGPNAINRIINSINITLNQFYKKDPIYLANASWLYSEKAKKRQSELESLLINEKISNLNQIYNKEYVLNNIKFPSLKKTFSILIDRLKIFELKRPLHIGHGDLCFNNILVDPIYSNIHLIDPRADKLKKFGEYGLIDNYYDISKLNHSISGLYDSVVNNLYFLRHYDCNNLSLGIYKPQEYEIYNKYFREIILEQNISEEELSLLTGNLFLTMLPLHADDYSRMVVLGLIGSIFINNFSLKKFFL